MKLLTFSIVFLLLQGFALVPKAPQILAAEKVQRPSSQAKKSPRLSGQDDYRSPADERQEEIPATTDTVKDSGQTISSLSGKLPEGGKASPPVETTGSLGGQSSRVSNWLLILANVLLLALLGERVWVIWRSRGKSQTFKDNVSALVEGQLALKIEIGRATENLKAISETIADFPFMLRTATAKLKESPDQESGLTSPATMKLISAVEQLPLRVKEEIVKELTLREKARDEEEAKKRSQLICDEIIARSKELAATFPIIGIASATRKLISPLASQVKDREGLAKNYEEYLKLDKQWEDLNNLQTRLVENPSNIQMDQIGQLKKRLQEIESLSDVLAKNHRSVWFTPLLDEASHFPSEQERVLRLKELLNIDEISLKPGEEIKNPRNVDVAAVEGVGNRSIVKEVLEKGYQERTSGLVLKKAKISVRLE